jgi:hypothetical protein
MGKKPKQIFKSFPLNEETKKFISDLRKYYLDENLSDSQIIRLSIKNLHGKLILNKRSAK